MMVKAPVFIMFIMLIADCNASRIQRRNRLASDLDENVTESTVAEMELNRTIDQIMQEQDMEDSEEEYDGEEEGLGEEGVWGCKNYCVQCNDGSTVWYGRDRNWVKMGASSTLGLIGAAAAGSGVGAVGLVAGAGAAGVLGASQAVQSQEETHTHWSGNIPSSGFFCEKVDVIKFPMAQGCHPQPFMEKSKKWLGRVKNNNLKPYDTKGRLMVEKAYQPSDMFAYKEGCKVVKAAGTRAFQQLSLGKFCKAGTTKGIHKCSAHSMLCGAAGVAGTSHAKSADKCRATCMNPAQGKLKCPARRSIQTPPIQPGYNNNGYNNQAYNPAPVAYPVQPGNQPYDAYPQQNYGTPQQPTPTYNAQTYNTPQNNAAPQQYGNQYGDQYNQPNQQYFGGYNPNA
jgi:hypothetical protein